MSKKVSVTALNNRVWYTEDGVHPSRPPGYLSLGKFGDPSQSFGDDTRITAPDPNNFQQDTTIGVVRGSKERGTITISNRYTVDKATLINLARKRCSADFYAAVGKCGDPQDFTWGPEKWVYIKDATPSNLTLENFGAFGTDENNPTNENADFTFEEFYEFLRLLLDEVADADAVREIYTIDVCDTVSCGDCDRQSDGCQRVLATMAGLGATPGTQPTLLYSDDSGVTWAAQLIDSMFSTEGITGAHCIGGDYVIITDDGNELHYTNINELYLGTNDWNQTDTGFVVGGEPLAIWSVNARHTWIVGNGGYIYFTQNHRASVTVQDPGVATAQNLNDVHAFDTENILAVGNANAVVFSDNGGDTWEAVVGPAAGVNLGACWMWDEDTWFVGQGAGGAGTFYYTDNRGTTWNEIGLPVNVDQIDRIKFVSQAEGYLTGRQGGSAVILRTITGGYEWVTLPDKQVGAIPANDYFNDIAVCPEGLNVMFAAGMGDGAAAGIIVKGEG